MRQTLGQILKSQGIVDDRQIEEALALQARSGTRIGQALVRLGHATEEHVARALARQSGLPFVDLGRGTIPKEVIDAIPKNVAEEMNVIPVKRSGREVILAVTDPLAVYNLENLRFLLNLDFRAALTTESSMRAAFRRYYDVEKKDAETVGETVGRVSATDADDAPVIRLVQSFIEDAVRARASDIHIEPMADRVRVRYRIDGVCRTVADHPKHLQGSLLSRVKIMAAMDIAEKRKPQDGRINTEVLNRDVDIRVSALPATHGESLVLRLLDRTEGLVSLERLGFGGDDLVRFKRIIRRPNGIFLVTGPTGSGKTTTLYAALQELNRPNVKIITAENPVEYHIAGINQCQVKHTIGLDFARILRAMLRQAPNIILIGEIRDQETANIAVQAALTGHLVFSTLHTNDAPSAITRLIDMNVAPFLVSASVMAVMAQRLVRTLCRHCRVPHVPEPAELLVAGLRAEDVAGATLFRPAGCPACHGTGYRGRIGIFELLEMSTELRDLTFRRAPASLLAEQARLTGGMGSLRSDGIRKALRGLTSLDEVLRVAGQEAGA